jgi:hypothetical protein
MDPVSVTILIVEIVGFVGGGFVIYRLKEQIDALKGTVDAHVQAVKTLS